MENATRRESVSKDIPVRWFYSAAGLLLLCHVLLVAWLDVHQSPNIDEVAHLCAGMARWQYGVCDIYQVNPPLVGCVAALPVLFMHYEEVWGDFEKAPRPRPEFVLGSQFVESHPSTWESFLVSARLAVLPFTILGGISCLLWAGELFGRKSGLIALTLWCFSPNILTWAAAIGTDGPAASFGVTAGYFFWRSLKNPTLSRALVAGVFLGLAELSKMTWVILFLIWPCIWLTWKFWPVRKNPLDVVTLLLVLVVGWFVLNLGYGFRGTFTKLGDFQFYSHVLSAETLLDDARDGGNRFRDTILQKIPLPFPRDYVMGADLQRWDFEKGHASYLFGKWSNRGWWYYYLVGFGLKTPIGTLGLILVAAAASISSFANRIGTRVQMQMPTGYGFRDFLVLGAPLVCGLILVSSQDGFSEHFRYVIPFLPFIFILASSAGKFIEWTRPRSSLLVLGLAGWSVLSSLIVYPHCISYFNGFAGGSANGHQSMLGSSFSWTQDHFYLREWLRLHPEVHSPYVSLDRTVPIERLGIQTRGEPPKLKLQIVYGEKRELGGPVPGWHVMSLQRVHDRDGGYLYFLRLKPAVRISHSTVIYHLSLSDVNQLRSELGLEQLNMPQRPTDFIYQLEEARRSRDHCKVGLLQMQGDQNIDTTMKAALDSSSISLTMLTATDVRSGTLGDFDVLVVPGGQASTQGSALGSSGREAIRKFVHKGGGYVGVCAGAYLAATNYDWSLNLVNTHTVSGERFVPGQGNVSAAYRGWGEVGVEITESGRRALGESVKYLSIDHTGGPIFVRSNDASLPDYLPLAYFRTELTKYPFQVGTMVDTPAIIASKFGEGCVILFSPHPETKQGAMALLINAIHCVAKPIVR